MHVKSFFPWLVTLAFTKCEVFTSSANMKRLQVLEEQLFTKLQQYVVTKEEKIQSVKKLIAELNTSIEGIDEIIPHPLNSIRLFKRFITGWNEVNEIISLDKDIDEGISALFKKGRARSLLPTTEDLEGVIDGILRLQTTYDLKPRVLAKGYLQGTQVNKPLGIENLFEIGMHAYKSKKYKLSIQWFSVVLEKLGSNIVMNGVSRADVYDYLAANFYEVGDMKNARDLTKKLLELEPNNFRVQKNLEHLRHVLYDMQTAGGNQDHENNLDDISKAELKTETEEYTKLCRGNSKPSAKHEIRHLRCWFRRRNVLLYLKPQKVERLWVSPDILLFHDIIQDSESNTLKDLAYPRLQRAKVFYVHTMAEHHDSSRISKNAWLDIDQHRVMKSLRMRVEAVTSLDMRFSESLQIANYGVGGHFMPHYDHGHENHANFSYSKVEKRIATLLFYLSKTEAGGRTVFTNAGASITPVKNSAVFWYNLRRNGRGDVRTKHAACPVMMGEKWVCNWWVHSDGQMLRRPCALNRNW